MVEAEVSLPKEVQEEMHGFPMKFLRYRPIVTRERIGHEGAAEQE